MKKVIAGFIAVMAMAVVSTAQAGGFALYEGSSKGVALGGGVVGKAVDASANFYNPATLTDLTNTVVTVGFVTEHPSADTDVNGVPGPKMDAGGFLLPHVYISQPLPADFTFGFGFAPEYGLGSKYNQSWALAANTTETTIEGLVLNPNLAYKVTGKWSVAAGIRVMYFSFDQYKNANLGPYGGFRNRLHGDNDFADWGWEIATKYDVTEKLSVGAVYKSNVDCKIKGTNRGYNGYGPMGPMYSGLMTGTASAKVRLPSSLTVGANYDITPELHFGTALTWTRWSTVQKIHFNLPMNDQELQLHWRDTYRFGFGFAYDFTKDLTGMISYVYDMDPTRQRYGSTMLPRGDRHIFAFGLAYRWDNWEFSAVYNFVFMHPDAMQPKDQSWDFDTHRGISHSAGVTVSYYF